MDIHETLIRFGARLAYDKAWTMWRVEGGKQWGPFMLSPADAVIAWALGNMGHDSFPDTYSLPSTVPAQIPSDAVQDP